MKNQYAHQAKWADRDNEYNRHLSVRNERRRAEERAIELFKVDVNWCLEFFDISTDPDRRNMEVGQPKYVTFGAMFRERRLRIKDSLGYHRRIRSCPVYKILTWLSQLDSPDHENWYLALQTIKLHFKL